MKKVYLSEAEWQEMRNQRESAMNFSSQRETKTHMSQVDGDRYTTIDVQLLDAMKSWMTPDEFKGFLRGNVIEYVARYGAKDGEFMRVDLLKAKHYLERLLEEID